MLRMNRRAFLGSLIGGVAATAAVRTWPFRVFSFPSELAAPSSGVEILAANRILTIAEITHENLRILENSISFTKYVARDADDIFGRVGAKIGHVLNIRKPVRLQTPLEVLNAEIDAWNARPLIGVVP